MLRLQVLLQRGRCAQPAPSRHHHQGILAHALAQDAVRQGQIHVQRKIDASGGQFRCKLLPCRSHHLQADLRRQCGKLLHQPRQHGRFQHGTQGQPEAALGAGRLELAALLQPLFQQVQRLLYRPDQAACQGRGHHGVPLAHEQRIPQPLAQPGQRVAERGLRQMQAPGGAGEVAFAVDGAKHQKQVEVEAIKMHGMNSLPSKQCI